MPPPIADNLKRYRKKRLTTDKRQLTMNRPPPYFPQNQLSPPDENRYKKFKYVIAGLILALIAVIIGAGFGVYYLIRWLF